MYRVNVKACVHTFKAHFIYKYIYMSFYRLNNIQIKNKNTQINMENRINVVIIKN